MKGTCLAAYLAAFHQSMVSIGGSERVPTQSLSANGPNASEEETNTVCH